MATYEKIDENKVEVTTTTTVTKESLEKEVVQLNRNIAHKETLRDEIEQYIRENY